MNLGSRVHELRTNRRLTLKDLAVQSGFSVSYLSDIERGRTIPALTTLGVLARAG